MGTAVRDLPTLLAWMRTHRPQVLWFLLGLVVLALLLRLVVTVARRRGGRRTAPRSCPRSAGSGSTGATPS